MKLHKTNVSDGEPGDAPLTPCLPMRTLLSRLADGSLTSGPAHWYAVHHVDGCPHCADALTALRALTTRLQALGFADAATAEQNGEAHVAPGFVLSVERWEAVLVAWETADVEGAAR